MRAYLPLCIALFCAGGGSAAHGQLQSDRAEGLQRICTYAGSGNLVTGATPQTYRVGIGQNCPVTMPPQEVSTQPPPPTAQLRSETLAETARACVYEEGGTSWSLAVAATDACPLFAGLVQQRANPSLLPSRMTPTSPPPSTRQDRRRPGS